MIAILSLLIVLALSLLVTRVATVALTHTGLSRESARFQARSAFTGAGFTTTESEKVVNHPVRRRVVLLLMLLGNAGIVTAVSSLILTFVGQEESQSLVMKIVLLSIGLAALWGVATSHWVERRMERLIERALRRFTDLDTHDYASLLHLAGEFRVTELNVSEDHWLAGRCLGEVRLRDEGVLILGIERRDGTFLGVPDGDTRFEAGDRVIVYGLTEILADVSRRRRDRQGERHHDRAVEKQREVQADEKREDARSQGENGAVRET